MMNIVRNGYRSVDSVLSNKFHEYRPDIFSCVEMSQAESWRTGRQTGMWKLICVFVFQFSYKRLKE
jgi:hypothetical protein